MTRVDVLSENKFILGSEAWGNKINVLFIAEPQDDFFCFISPLPRLVTHYSRKQNAYRLNRPLRRVHGIKRSRSSTDGGLKFFNSCSDAIA